jgi:hypothetical protein
LRFEKRDVASIKEGLQICSRAAGNFRPRIYLNLTSLHPHSEKQERLKKGFYPRLKTPILSFLVINFFLLPPPSHHRHTNAAVATMLAATVLTTVPAPVLRGPALPGKFKEKFHARQSWEREMHRLATAQEISLNFGRSQRKGRWSSPIRGWGEPHQSRKAISNGSRFVGNGGWAEQSPRPKSLGHQCPPPWMAAM